MLPQLLLTYTYSKVFSCTMGAETIISFAHTANCTMFQEKITDVLKGRNAVQDALQTTLHT